MSRARFPRLALAVGWTAVLGSLTLAVYGSATGMAKSTNSAQAVASRALLFADRADGAVVIKSAAGETIDVEQGQAGFLRGTLRGFARARHADHIGPELPMTLTAYADGRLILLDPATKRQVDLEAFGVDNEIVFSRLLGLEPRGTENGV